MSETASISLSTNGLRQADRVSRKDFRFVCRSGGDAFVCDRFQAAFVSPRLANWLFSDPSIGEFSESGDAIVHASRTISFTRFDQAMARESNFDLLSQWTIGDIVVSSVLRRTTIMCWIIL
jgi:hypothetical protein